ncbi:MAG TPA: SDR family oxidoreductase [Spirochaetia bacterium]|nr:SDR family oxidoreductase [Spirochaetia bacterium]
MQQSLSGKVVIITGASSGIGAAAARELARLGCKLALASRSTDTLTALAAELGPSACAVPTDVTSGAEVDRLVSTTLERFGGIDILLANAGIYVPGKLWEGDPEKLARLVDVNVNGVLRCIRAVLPPMKARHAGDILVTSSISGHLAIPWEPVYSASKHAVQALVHTLRRQAAPDGIRVGAVAPGMVANELWGITTAGEVERHVRERSALRNEDVVDAMVFMLTRPPHVTVRDLVMLPQSQDL